jgi:pyruvate dehydrogenase E1 component alpha subunit
MALQATDYLSYTYRGHGVCIARGMSPAAAFAELFGRRTGISGGLGGSMHLTDPDIGLMGSFGIVGAGIPFAAGNALAAQTAGDGRVAATFFGDGATNIGAFHEAMNLAAVWSLPLLFVCENNLYGEYSRIDRTTPFEDIARRAAAYAMRAVIVDGNDVLAVYDAVADAACHARAGKGPSFIECKTYRQGGHSRTDPAKYRPEEEVRAWLARDPLVAMRKVLDERGLLASVAAEALERQVRAEMETIAAKAATDPWPEFDEGVLLAATYA